MASSWLVLALTISPKANGLQIPTYRCPLREMVAMIRML